MIKLQVIGNLGQDAKVSETNGQKAINFSIAHNMRTVDNEGVVNETTTWVNCTMWKDKEKSADVVKYLTKGTKVFVEGLPKVKGYKKDGEHYVSLNLVVQRLDLLTVKDKPDENADNSVDDPEF